jgi:hypothetical protein
LAIARARRESGLSSTRSIVVGLRDLRVPSGSTAVGSSTVALLALGRSTVATSARSAVRRTTRKVVPLRGLGLSATKVPSWASTIDGPIDRQRPRPGPRPPSSAVSLRHTSHHAADPGSPPLAERPSECVANRLLVQYFSQTVWCEAIMAVYAMCVLFSANTLSSSNPIANLMR